MTWKPHPATIAYRVIKYLKTLPRGKFIATGPLASEMDQPSSALITSLYRPVEQGLIVREKRDGFYHWSLTDRGHDLVLDIEQDADAPGCDPEPEPKPGPLSDTVNDDTMWGGPARPPTPAPLPANKKASASKPSGKKPRAVAAPVDIDRVHPKPAAPAVEPAQDEPFKFSWSSDDVLTVSKAGASVSMTPAEFQKLARFIDVIGRAQL